jgi:hypothetical protein
MKQITTLGITLALLGGVAQAKTMDEIIKAGGTPEEIGKAIIVEADVRDLGFESQEVEVTMVLKNAQGQSSTRQMRNKTFELQQKDVGDKTMIIFDQPRDVAGTAFLTYSQILQPDDQWLYLPALKRVKRISSKNKSGPFMGSEFSYEDISSPEVGKYTYKYIGAEACGKMDCTIVERYPLYEHSGYTKQVVYLDNEEFRPIIIKSYDRKGDLLKTLEYKGYQQYLDKYWRADAFYMVNHQTGKSTDLLWTDYQFKTGLKESDFVKGKLRNAR